MSVSIFGRSLAAFSACACVVAAAPSSVRADNDAWLNSVFSDNTAIARSAKPVSQRAPEPSPVFSSACAQKENAWKSARQRYNRRAGPYWNKIARMKSLRKKRRARGYPIRRADYVLSHPPVYKGPSRPKCLDAGKPKAKPKPSTIGTVADFLAAARKHYNFRPSRTNEVAYKRIYAREALANGLTENQVVGVYALETGGIGPYYRQSGIFPIDYQCRPIKTRGRQASTALGYAQLLAANSMAMIHDHGLEFAKRMEFEALQTGPQRKAELNKKAAVLREMVRDIKRGIRRYRNRNNWREFVAFGKTSRGYAIHAMNLDPDVGPLMQVYKLRRIVRVAGRKGFPRINGAQLELLNLVGYGRGLEMLTGAARNVPTSNFFSRGGYFRNPVAKNRTSLELLRAIGDIIVKRRKNCGAVEFTKIFREVSALAKNER